MNLEVAVVKKAGGYVWARALGSIGYLLVLVGSGSFRGMQDTLTPAIASLAAVRLIQIALVAGTIIALALALPRDKLPLLFSSDLQVVEKVRHVMPLVVVMLPIDAVERTLEGGLLGCQQTDFIARNTLVLIVVRFLGGFRRFTIASSPVGDLRKSEP
ncbi:hypothetical protein WJX79_007315 [Trebouxia sp. C0005]